MLVNTIEQRQRGWEAQRKAEGPKRNEVGGWVAKLDGVSVRGVA